MIAALLLLAMAEPEAAAVRLGLLLLLLLLPTPGAEPAGAMTLISAAAPTYCSGVVATAPPAAVRE